MVRKWLWWHIAHLNRSASIVYKKPLLNMNFDCEFYFEELKIKRSLIFFATLLLLLTLGLALSFIIFFCVFWFVLLSYLLFFNEGISFLEFCQRWFLMLSCLHFSIFFENSFTPNIFRSSSKSWSIKNSLFCKFLFRFWCSVDSNLKKSIIKKVVFEVTFIGGCILC